MNTELVEFRSLLPDTWGVKAYDADPECLILNVPRDEGGGSLTLNTRKRWWCPGMFTRPSYLSKTPTWYEVHLYGGDKRYRGRGWRPRMLEDINLALARGREADCRAS